MDATERRSRSAAKRKSCLISVEVRIDKVSAFRRDMTMSRHGVRQCTAFGYILAMLGGLRQAMTVRNPGRRRKAAEAVA